MEGETGGASGNSCLFPAFRVATHTEGESVKEGEWLTNPSFPADQRGKRTWTDIQTGENKASNEASSSDVGGVHSHRYAPPEGFSDKKQLDQNSSAINYEKQTKRGKKRKKEKHKHKHKSKKSKKSRERRSSSEESLSPPHKKDEEELPVGSIPGCVFLEDLRGRTIKDNARYDTKPDRENWSYLTLYRQQIAHYHRLGLGCLGLDHIIFDRRSSKDPKDNQTSRYWQRLRQKKKELSQLLYPQRGTDCNVDVQPFIPFTSDPPEKQPDASVNPLGIYDPATERYLLGKPLSEQTMPKHVMKEGESDSHPLMVKKAWFNQYLVEKPQDVEAWVEWIKFQEELVPYEVEQMSGREVEEKTGAFNKRVVLDIQATVVDIALERNPTSVDLKLKRLEILSEVWEAERVGKEWERMVEQHPGRLDVWKSWLQFLQSSLRLFTVSKTMEAYSRCLTTLTDQSHGSGSPAILHTSIIGIFRELVMLLKRSGHREKAVALLQANTELNLYCPQVLQAAPLERKLAFLENFWDSGCPRAGEIGALGLATWMERQGDVPYHSMYSKDEEIRDEDEVVALGDRTKGWMSLEMSRSARHLFPWRPDTKAGESEDDCEDLERIVMLDDVKSCLFTVTSPSDKLLIVKVYLDFLGIHIPMCDLENTEGETMNCLENLSQLSPMQGLVNGGHLEGRAGEREHNTAVQLLLQVSTAQVFTSHHDTFISLALIYSLRQFLLLKKQDHLQHEKAWKTVCKDTRKKAKNALKKESNRSNLLVWEEYIYLEYAITGSLATLRPILDTTLSMSPPFSPTTDFTTRSAVCKIYRRYTELELDLPIPGVYRTTENQQGNIPQALHLLTSLPHVNKSGYTPRDDEASGASPAQILTARHLYQRGLDTVLAQSEGGCNNTLQSLPQTGTLLAHWTVCWGLLEYLTQGISAATAVLDKVLGMMDRNKDVYSQSVHVDVTCSKLILLERHVATHIVPLRVLRLPLMAGLEQLPDHPRLLHMLTQLEGRSDMVGRLRRLLNGVAAEARTPLVRVYGAVAELTRLEKAARQETDLLLPVAVPSTGSHQQLRTWLEAAVHHPRSRHTILLWRLFFHFEISVGNKSGAKRVYYMAIDHCPGAKVLCLDYVQVFPEFLEEVLDYMLEKELRLRTPPEELDLLLPAPTPPPPSEEEEELGQEQEENRQKDQEQEEQKLYKYMS